MKRLLVLAGIIFVALQPNEALAQWQLDGAPVAVPEYWEGSPTIASDGAGGAIIAWQDFPFGYFPDIYVQRINAAGVLQWTARGVILCAAADYQVSPKIVSDGAGGAIVTWHDYRNFNHYDIYAQRINASGVVQWTTDGVLICGAAGYQTDAAIVSDGSGGAIVTWHDNRGGATADIYAQRVNSLGATQWTANGVPLCTATNNQYYPLITADGSGGAIVTWQDNRAGNWDVYSQRVNASGVVQWTVNGVHMLPSSPGAFNQYVSAIVSDGAGGAILTWQDFRSGNYDVFVGRIGAAGGLLWSNFGVALTNAAGDQLSTAIVSDGAGGGIVAWYDSNLDVYARRVNAAGNAMWLSSGVALCTAPAEQSNPVMASDGAGGAIVAWRDKRSGDFDVYAQRVDAAGIAQWTANGVPFSAAPYDQNTPVIVSDAAGGAISAWTDARGGYGNADIFAQRIESTYGYWGHPEPALASVADIPNDQGGKVSVDWVASGRDQSNERTIGHYSIWRAVSVLPANSELTNSAKVGLGAHGPVFASLTPQSDYFWELVGTQPAHGLDGYSFSASTRADSVAGDTGTEQFMVLAHDQNDDYIAFKSNVMSGHSVDNLAPASPLLLTAQRVGSDVHLRWNRVRVADLRDYSLYRATSSGVTPVPINFLTSSDDTLATDASAPASALYYVVTALDVHANQSAPSNEAAVGALTGIGDIPPITTLTVLQNHPNPFAAETEMVVGLPARSDVRVEVFDVGGRQVSTIEVKDADAGWRKIPFSGRDLQGRPLASGVYFYRVEASGATITNKMVITR